MKDLYKLFLASALMAVPQALSAHPFKIETVVPEVALEWSGDESCVH